MLEYPIPYHAKRLILTDETINHVLKYRQINPKDKEAGGQLFAKFNGNKIIIERATGPTLLDIRSRATFAPNRWLERRGIKKTFKKGLHYIGDWHTHPESFPSPSLTDIKSLNETFIKSDHELDWFVLLIAGRCDPPDGLFVGLIDGKTPKARELHPC